MHCRALLFSDPAASVTDLRDPAGMTGRFESRWQVGASHWPQELYQSISKLCDPCAFVCAL